MAKSNTSSRSNSIDTTAECVSPEPGSPRSGVTPLVEDTESQCDLLDDVGSLSLPSSSPPPSYNYVLEETRLRVQNQDTSPTLPIKGPEIIHKSSKELYKAVAKQFGITCKMSDQCRCLDCQSHYFDCEYEQNEQDKSDGGLGAGGPMFISEVMHGTACSIL